MPREGCERDENRTRLIQISFKVWRSTNQRPSGSYLQAGGWTPIGWASAQRSLHNRTCAAVSGATCPGVRRSQSAWMPPSIWEPRPLVVPVDTRQVARLASLGREAPAACFARVDPLDPTPPWSSTPAGPNDLRFVISNQALHSILPGHPQGSRSRGRGGQRMRQSAGALVAGGALGDHGHSRPRRSCSTSCMTPLAVSSSCISYVAPHHVPISAPEASQP